MVILFAISLLIIGLSIPMIRRRVPPNRWYGLRVSATFEDESVWYDANEQGGRDLLSFGVILALWSLTPMLFDIDGHAYALIWTMIAIAGAIGTAWIGWRRANRMRRERTGGNSAPRESTG